MNPSTKARLLHALTFLLAVGTAVVPAWVDPQQTLAGRIAITAVTALLLGVKTSELRTQRNAILGGLAIAAALVAGIAGKWAPGTAGFAVVGSLAAIITQVRTMLARELADAQPATPPETKGPGPMKAASILIVFGALLAASPARADINLDDIAPKVTKCWGSTCIMPDAAVNAVLFDLSTKKWEAGTVSLGAGLALLFAADQAYASGITAHLTGVLSQEAGKASFAMPTVGVIVARYFEVGYSYRFADGGPNASYISVAGNIPWDVFTKATLPQRATAARLQARGLVRAEDF